MLDRRSATGAHSQGRNLVLGGHECFEGLGHPRSAPTRRTGGIRQSSTGRICIEDKEIGKNQGEGEEEEERTGERRAGGERLALGDIWGARRRRLVYGVGKRIQSQ